MSENLSPEFVIKHSPYFNYTFCLNKYNFLYEVQLQNIAENLLNVKIIISSSGSFENYELFFDEIKTDTEFKITKFDFLFNLSLIKNLTEKDIDVIRITLFSNEKEICHRSFNLEIFPMDHFGGLQVLPQLLSSYIIPNHPSIYQIKTEAIKILEDNNLSPAFEGYQTKSKERILQVISSIYKAIQNHELIYSSMPPSFESQGQRIRLVDQVISTKFGNCIDISLLFAACLEAIDLNPIIVITKGHAFVGVWLEDQRFDAMINYDQAAISKRIASGIKDIALIESTSICKGQNVSFNQAIASAEMQLMNDTNFILSIDVKNTRSNGISPLPIHKEDFNLLKDNTFSRSNSDLDEDYEIGETYDDLELTDLSNLTKQKIWERKLLDLSLRNNLLNLRFTKSMLQIVDLKTNLLEDTLAEGKAYTIHPNNDQPITRKYNNYIAPLHPSVPLFKLADDEFKYNKLLTTYHHDDLDTILTHLYRTSKLAEEENGKSTLYLGIGLLKWFDPKNKTVPRFAPILLIPVELSRRSVNSKFMLRSREEETMINITLIEYLKQGFNLNLNGLENLPMDESGVDVPKVLAIVRNAILNLEGWDVLEQIVLGIFSFNKLILWQDLSKYSEEIQKNAIVKSLIDGKLSDHLESVEGNDLELENLSASALTLPISADNSQLNAIKNANLNKTFILHGPPGTGKSQTITNIIADALSNDKKVLFVAAKKAALDVVNRRLESIGLGPFCLELHSNKSKKSDVLQQFERTLETPKYKLNSDFQEEARRLDDRRKELSKYITQLHHKNRINWSLFDSISFLENNDIGYEENLKVDLDFEELNLTKWNSWNDWLIPFSSVVSKIGQPNAHPLNSVKLQTHQFDHKNNLISAIDQYLDKFNLSKGFFEKYQIEKEHLSTALEVLNFIKNNSIKTILFDDYFDENQNVLLKSWININTEKQNIEAEINSKFSKSILNLDIENLRMTWNQAKHIWFFPKWLKQRKVKSQLQGYATSQLNSEEAIDHLFSNLDEYKSLTNNLTERKFDSFIKLQGLYLGNDKVEVAALKNDFQNIEILHELMKKSSIQNPQHWLRHNFIDQDILQDIDPIISSSQDFDSAKNELEKYLHNVPELDVLNDIKENIHQLEDWINYNIYHSKAAELGINWFTSIVEKGKSNTNRIEFEFNKIVHFNHFLQSIYISEVLNSFDANIYESLIKQYQDLNKEFVNLTKNQLILKLSANIPNFSQEAVQSSEIGILQKAIRSKGRGLSIRRLFDQIPNLIPRLKPCMLMSPISVAQYFDVNEEHFDLVIFDEASQLPTSEAISALARSKQAIIVGDPKQMPPTSFFTSNKVDEDNMEMEDLESILEDCLALSIPSSYLLKHYRSKHESLISFSNKNFYDSKLLTFPSPDDQNQKVTFQFVVGNYDKGKTRTNKNEAAAIINYIKNHLATKNKKSLGVVTFSQTQQILLEDLLLKLFQENPSLEEFSLKNEEPIFIKNLENVQGDERDIILFSVGYGPDEEGKISMNFGPLNRDGGWRRLNVAVTRARYEMKVFSSLRGDQIDLNRTNSQGVKGLKDFLNFAEKGNYALNNSTLNSDKISLIDSIAQHLTKSGLNVKKHIGTSGYKVDLGIIDVNNLQEYIMGILVDGDNYFNINTTNDRELLTPSVLQGLGWNIFRIWTLDWLKNKDKIVEAIKLQIEKNINEVKAKEPEFIPDYIETIEPLKSTGSLIEIDDLGQSNLIIPYKVAVIEPAPFANSESIYYVENRTLLLNQMKELISTEAPISKNLLIRKTLKLWNTARAGSKLNNYLTEIVESIPTVTKTNAHQEFYWSEEINPENLQHYRDNTVEKRMMEDIAQEEINIAIMEIMKNNLSVNRDDLVRLTSKFFGFLKVGTQIDAVINYSIENLIDENKLLASENRITIV